MSAFVVFGGLFLIWEELPVESHRRVELVRGLEVRKGGIEETLPSRTISLANKHRYRKDPPSNNL